MSSGEPAAVSAGATDAQRAWRLLALAQQMPAVADDLDTIQRMLTDTAALCTGPADPLVDALMAMLDAQLRAMAALLRATARQIGRKGESWPSG